VPVITQQQVTDKLRDFLEHGPLFKKLELSLEPHDVSITWPTSLTFFCSRCKASTTWFRDHKSSAFTGITVLSYKCADCRKFDIRFLIHIYELEDNYFVEKVGQHPAPSIDIPKELRKNLDDENVDLYKRGLICRNQGFGLGAVVYFRRVVENTINSMLDSLAEYCKNDAQYEQILRDIEAVKIGKKTAEKLKLAAKLIPSSLKPGDGNPFDLLYQLLSESIHSQSEDEALNRADEIQQVFVYVFGQLKVGVKERKKYLEAISVLEKKRSATKGRSSANS